MEPINCLYGSCGNSALVNLSTVFLYAFIIHLSCSTLKSASDATLSKRFLLARTASNRSCSTPKTTFEYIWIRRLYESKANRSSLKVSASCSTLLSFKPIFKMESIIPGIEILPPDLTESKSGVPSLSKLLPEIVSNLLTASLISLSRFSGSFLFSVK